MVGSESRCMWLAVMMRIQTSIVLRIPENMAMLSEWKLEVEEKRQGSEGAVWG